MAIKTFQQKVIKDGNESTNLVNAETRIRLGLPKGTVLIQDCELKPGSKESESFLGLRDSFECNLVLEDDQAIEICTLRVTPDGRGMISGTFFQDFQSLDDLASRIGLDEDPEALNSIKKLVESTRNKLLKA